MDDIRLTYQKLLEELIIFAREIEVKIIKDDDDWFKERSGFYTKSFLISGCTYLESFLKDMGYFIVDDWKRQVDELRIPSHLIDIKYDKKVKGLNEEFCLNFSHSDVDDRISGNVDKTIKFFELLSIDLKESSDFQEHKLVIARFVENRNQIIHHNYHANNISIGDIISWLENNLGPYGEAIFVAVKAKYP